VPGWLPKLVRAVLVPPVYLAVVVVGWALASLPLYVDSRTMFWPALAGFVVAELFLLSGIRFIRLYVVGHELTHWVAAKLFRRRTGRFLAAARSGSVEVENPNVFIILAPYVIPAYTLVLVGVYGVVGIWVDPIPDWGVALFCGGLGATYAFHLTLTLLALQRGQEDLRLCGPVFSLGLILLGNVVLVFLAMVVVDRLWTLAFGVLAQRTVDLGHLFGDACRLAWYVLRGLRPPA
jgi:hypothetical protein